MNSLWAGLALLSLVALGFIIVPVLRYRKAAGSTAENERRRSKNVELYQQRLTEIERELGDELLEASEAETVRTELQRSFLRDMKALEGDASGSGAVASSTQLSWKLLPLMSGLAVPLAAVWLYLGWGAAQDLALPGLIADIRQSQTETEEREALLALAEALDARFDRHPDDIQNGYTLGSLYVRTEQFTRAAMIFTDLVDKVESPMDQAAVLGQLAQSQYLSAQEQLTPLVQSTIDRALALNPNEQAIMSLLAVESFLNQDVAGALKFWRRQLTQLSAGSADHEVLARRIALVESQYGGVTAAQTEGPAVTLHVDISEEARVAATADMRVFVFARNPDSGMPMPLAARFFSVDELPITVTLSDADAMAEGMPTLSSAERVVVGARLSSSAQRQSGDFEALSSAMALAEELEVSLVISDLVP